MFGRDGSMSTSLPPTFHPCRARWNEAPPSIERKMPRPRSGHADADTATKKRFIPRIDLDTRDLLAVAQAEMRPRLSGVGGLVHAVADREIRPLQSFAAADINDVGVREGHRNRPDRAGRLVVEDGRPGAPRVDGLPHAAVHHPHIEGERLARDAGQRLGPPRAHRADVAPPHLREQAGVAGARGRLPRRQRHGGARKRSRRERRQSCEACGSPG